MKLEASRRLFLGLVALGGIGCASSAAGAVTLQDDDLLLNAIQRHSKAPDAYLVDLFEDADVIFLGEDHAIKQHLDFVASLIPKLYAAGVRNVVMEFGAEEDQARLDKLVTAPHYDEAAAQQIMFNYNSMWSWKEYRAIYHAAWALNRTLKPGLPRFRIINMSYRFRWSLIGNGKTRTPESMSRVFWRGTVDKFRSEIIEREILDKKEKGLVLTGFNHAMTRYQEAAYVYNADGFHDYEYSLGNRLYQSYGSRVRTILFHRPFPDRTNPSKDVIPGNGAIERLMVKNGNKPIGFDLHGGILGALRDDSRYADCHPEFTLGDVADGYIFLAPLGQLKPATPDYTFVTESNLAEALAQFPDPDGGIDQGPRPHTLDEVNAHIRNMADSLSARYGAFK